MKKWFLALLAISALAALAYWLLHPSPPGPNIQSELAQTSNMPGIATAEGTSRSHSPAAAPTFQSTNALEAPAVGSNPPMRPGAPKAAASSPAVATPAPAGESPSGLPPATLLENMRTTIRQYGLMFGGNPVGTNPEITKALNGDNPKQVKFLGPDGNRINEKGELVDAWGTPYFFHQLSAMEMEIRSAGPDRIMWTEDDLVMK